MPTETLYRTDYFLNMSDRVFSLIELPHDRKVEGLMKLLLDHDRITFEHSYNVAHFAYVLAKETGLNQYICRHIFETGLLHDIGKLFIPKEIINRRSNSHLSKREHNLLVSHWKMGAEILKELKFGAAYSLVADQHWMGEFEKDPKPEDLAVRHFLVHYITIADLVASAFDLNRVNQPDFHPEQVIRFVNQRFERNIFPKNVAKAFNKIMVDGRHTFWYGKNRKNNLSIHR